MGLFSLLVGRDHISCHSYKFPHMGFTHSSVGRESTCNVGDPGSIPGSGRSSRAGIGCPLQYSWAPVVAQLVKNPPVMRETWVRILGWEDPLEKGKATHSSILARRIPWTGEPGRLRSTGSQRVGHDWVTSLSFSFTYCFYPRDKELCNRIRGSEAGFLSLKFSQILKDPKAKWNC